MNTRKAVRENRKPARKKSEAARKKKELTRAKQFLIAIGIIMLYFLWTGAPYIADCIERNTQTVSGEVIETRKERVGKRGRGRVYFYTLKALDGTEIEVKVAGNHTEVTAEQSTQERKNETKWSKPCKAVRSLGLNWRKRVILGTLSARAEP